MKIKKIALSTRFLKDENNSQIFNRFYRKSKWFIIFITKETVKTRKDKNIIKPKRRYPSGKKQLCMESITLMTSNIRTASKIIQKLTRGYQVFAASLLVETNLLCRKFLKIIVNPLQHYPKVAPNEYRNFCPKKPFIQIWIKITPKLIILSQKYYFHRDNNK